MNARIVGGRLALASGVILLSVLLVGCGLFDPTELIHGGGGVSPPTDNVATGPHLLWTPPTSYTDGTPLDPEQEIRRYEVVISALPTISEESIVGVVIGGTADRFDLGLFRTGQEQWVTVRCVSVDNVPSDFAPAILWGGK